MLEGKVVYLADDDHEDRHMMKEALQEANPGAYIIEAENGKELLINIQNSQYLLNSVVIVDMNMPAMNGFEAIQKIKDNPRYINLPTIMMTTSSDENHKIQAIKAGANGFITKPVSMEALLVIAEDIFKLFFTTRTAV